MWLLGKEWIGMWQSRKAIRRCSKSSGCTTVMAWTRVALAEVDLSTFVDSMSPGISD